MRYRECPECEEEQRVVLSEDDPPMDQLVLHDGEPGDGDLCRGSLSKLEPETAP